MSHFRSPRGTRNEQPGTPHIFKLSSTHIPAPYPIKLYKRDKEVRQLARMEYRRKTAVLDDPGGPMLSIAGVSRGCLEAFLMSVVLLAISSLFVTYTPLSDRWLPLLANLSAGTSVFWGGSRSARIAGRGLVLNGALVGVVYGVALLFLGAWLLAEPIVAMSAVRIIVAAFIAGLGGLLVPRRVSYKRR